MPRPWPAPTGSPKPYFSANRESSAGFAELFHPAGKHVVVRRLDVYEFNAHADPRLHDTHHGQRFHLLVLPRQGDSNAGVRSERPARADERAAHGNVGGNALCPGAGFHIQQHSVRSKRVANGIPSIANRAASRVAFQCSVVHGNDVAHSCLRRAANGYWLPGACPIPISLPQSRSNMRFQNVENAKKTTPAGPRQRPALSQHDITWNDKPVLLQPARSRLAVLT